MVRSDSRDPVIWAELFADKLGWQLGKQERAIEYGHSIVIIIGVQPKIRYTACLSLTKSKDMDCSVLMYLRKSPKVPELYCHGQAVGQRT